MSYEKTTIQKAIFDIDQRRTYLPALQRKFVWGKPQIELLFDSLMRNYPFGAFLFWKLKRTEAENYVFYDFLKKYDERQPYNVRKTGAFSHPEILGVLDGQQRLSSIYIGLMGTHTEKAPGKHKSNPRAYEEMSLYLNLLSLPYIVGAENKIAVVEERNFEFRFLADERALSSVERKADRAEREDGSPDEIESMFWMKVGKALSWDNEPEFDQIIEDLQGQCQSDAQRAAFVLQKRFIKRGLDTLHRRIQKDELINYFEIEEDDLENILKIFVRVNSGGTVLNKTDLLFSTIVATWDDGREQIEKLLKKINALGSGFIFGSEYLMRCCLVLSDGPVVYKVNSFKSENVQRIRDEWPGIASAVEQTVQLLVEYGFSGSVLTSQNATIPIAYYIYKGGDQSKRSKTEIQKYLIHALLKGTYSSSQEQVLRTLRDSLREEIKAEDGSISYRRRFGNFSFDDVLKVTLPQGRTLAVNAEDIERFLQFTKGPASFFVLSLLYPQLRYNEVAFDQDHIHPYAFFTKEKFAEMGVPDDQWQEWLDCRDCVPNLQLMESGRNKSKHATPFKIWFQQQEDSYRALFAQENYLPVDASLDFRDFLVFFKRRKERLRTALEKALALSSAAPTEVVQEWGGHDEEAEVQGNRLASGE